MGDVRRHDAFAALIAQRWPDRQTRIADVAAGKGGLRAALYRLGYRNVTCFDRRPKMAKRPYYRYGLFRADTEPESFELVVGMHPDHATDEILEYALTRRIPFAVVPCCTRPSAWPYSGPSDYPAWMSHLRDTVARRAHVHEIRLPIRGANRCLTSQL